MGNRKFLPGIQTDQHRCCTANAGALRSGREYPSERKGASAFWENRFGCYFENKWQRAKNWERWDISDFPQTKKRRKCDHTDRSRSTWESDIQNDSCTISEGRYKRGKSTASGRLLDFGRNICYHVSVCIAHGDIWNRFWQKRGKYKKNLCSGKRLLCLWNIGRDGWQQLVSVPLLETDREDFREKSDRSIKGGSGI